jgi:hypothetical protein
MSHTISTDELITLHCAFRYALGRKTYVVSSVVNQILSKWDVLPLVDKRIFKEDILKAISVHKAGMEQDIKEWRRVLDAR